MEPVRVVYDREGNTLDVWFGRPQEATCEEIGGGIVIKKNADGDVVGFEKLCFLSPEEAEAERQSIGLRLPVEIMVI